MQEFNEPKTIGLTSETKEKLRRLKEDGYFHEMQDGYKFAVGLAILYDALDSNMTNAGTMYGTGDLDQNKDIYEIVKALRTSADEPVYKTVERYAEWGVKELYEQSLNEGINFSKLLSIADSSSNR